MYIAIWTVEVNVPNPYWDHNSSRLEPEYIKDVQQRFKRFDTKEQLADFVIANQELAVNYYLVAKEVCPKIDITVNVDI